MPSLVSGYEYDIFISYRHNDNRSGWVTEFVRALQEELATTIKDPVSVYFDTNPHDGLLETHSVDKSLEGKLKCLVLISVISQTYCDTKSFAWQHEFCAFNKLSKADQFGRDIKLSNGNVASRILPVKIHDLDRDDLAIIENELSGAMRPVEFIYRSAGVNRPLATSDNPDKNLSKTYYRDQINKVANGIKEILIGLKHFENPAQAPKIPNRERAKPNLVKIAKIVAISIPMALAAGYMLFNIVDIVGLSNEEQLPRHKLILPLFIITIVAVVGRQPIGKMGSMLMHISAASIFAGGLADVLYTFTSSSLPDAHVKFIKADPKDISDSLVQMEFALLRTIGTTMMAVGLGCWLLLQILVRQRNKNLLIAFVTMATLTEGNNSFQLYTLGLPFWIYTVTNMIVAWIGAVLWWKGPSLESSSLTQE